MYTPIRSSGSHNATVSPIIWEPTDTRPDKTFGSAIAVSTEVTIETGSMAVTTETGSMAVTTETGSMAVTIETGSITS